MKKLVITFITVFLLFSMTGCDRSAHNGGATTGNSHGPGSSGSDSTSEGAEIPNGETNMKILVAYYSATGTTEKIAKAIVDFTGADVFVIEPEDAYTSEDLDWTDENSRVSLEHRDPDKRTVALKAVTPNHFEEYDVVLIGYPIWWGSAAWPVNDFVKENDFTGKMVIPFCTAASSDIGESGDLLAQIAGTGDWQQGRRFYNRSSEDEVSDWLRSLHLN